MSSPTDDFVCSTHTDQVVALYCQTCAELICPRCISSGPSSSGHHVSHVFLDLSDAYHIKKKDLGQMLVNFKDATQTKRNEHKELTAKGQKLKLELLRKKTLISKETHSIHQAINKHEKDYFRQLSASLQPALVRNSTAFSEVDYDVISREGVIGAAEALCEIPEEKAIKFLRAQEDVEKDIVRVSSCLMSDVPDCVPELRQLQRENLSLRQYKHVLNHAFSSAKQVPNAPRILPSWSTIGHKSASITFKTSNRDQVSSCVVVCESYNTYRDLKTNNKCHNKSAKSLPDSCQSQSDKLIIKRNKVKFTSGNRRPFWQTHQSDSQVFKLKVRPGRMVVVIRNLQPGKKYVVQVYAVNSQGVSEVSEVFLTTLPVPKVADQGHITQNDRRKSYFQFLRTFFVLFMKYLLMLIIFVWATFAIYLSREQVLNTLVTYFSHICDLLWHLDNPYINYFYELLCPRKIPDFEALQTLFYDFGGASFLQIGEYDTIEFASKFNTTVNSVLEWLVKFGENRMDILW